MPKKRPSLSDSERARYEWQMWTSDFGEAGQQKLREASVLVSRVGGVGGTVAYYLAAAGIGKLLLAHAGTVKPSDLNRQLLMTTDWLGKPRVESARRRLNELNPCVQVDCVAENISSQNADVLISQVDVVVDAAPLFEERFAMNQSCVQLGKPMVECAMYDLNAQLTTLVPGKTPCLQCLLPAQPPAWKRQFPVFGAVSGMIASMAVMEAIKLIAGIEHPLMNSMLHVNLRSMEFKKLPILRNPKCMVCGHLE